MSNKFHFLIYFYQSAPSGFNQKIMGKKKLLKTKKRHQQLEYRHKRVCFQKVAF